MVREIVPRSDAREWRPLRPSRKHAKWQAILVVIGLLAIGVGMPPTPTEAGSWTAWVTHWYPAKPAECAKARALLAQKRATFIGPIPIYNHGCYYPIRSRHRSITMYDYYYDGYAASRPIDGVTRSTTVFPSSAWTYETVQIGNTSPIWDVWGMKMNVDVAYNGVVATYNPDSKWCNDYSFGIKVTPLTCDVLSSGSSDELVRMAYTASFIQSGLFFSVQHGAQKHVYGTGPADFTFWPVR